MSSTFMERLNDAIPKANDEANGNGWVYDPNFLEKISDLGHVIDPESISDDLSLEVVEVIIRAFLAYLILEIDYA